MLRLWWLILLNSSCFTHVAAAALQISQLRQYQTLAAVVMRLVAVKGINFNSKVPQAVLEHALSWMKQVGVPLLFFEQTIVVLTSLSARRLHLFCHVLVCSLLPCSSPLFTAQ
jgi:hypothetical protein